MTKQYEYHQYANIFAMLVNDDLNELAESIRANGLDNPIALYQGKILDGRNRYQACLLVGVVPNYVDFDGTDQEALDFSFRQNAERRHLTTSQRAMAAAKYADFQVGMNQHSGGSANLHTLNDASNKMDVSKRSTAAAKKVMKEASPEVVEAVEQGKMTVNAAHDALDLPKQEQTRIAQSEKPADELREHRIAKASKAKMVLNPVDCDGDLTLQQITHLFGSVRGVLSRGNEIDQETRNNLIKRMDCGIGNLQRMGEA
ncbi:MAG: hypothetical protein GKR96_11470 [Gammaproteobacteria bacterium]|nr:hypothetical protein [Gammaproteobacteria bacterium]